MTKDQTELVTRLATTFANLGVGTYLVSRNLRRATGRSVTFREAYGVVSVVGWLSYFAARNAFVGWNSAKELKESTLKVGEASK